MSCDWPKLIRAVAAAVRAHFPAGPGGTGGVTQTLKVLRAANGTLDHTRLEVHVANGV